MEHLINLNFAPGGLPATVHVSQYDDTIRQLRFQLWFGRSKVEVPSGAAVRVDIKKPDGHIVLVNGTVNSSDRSIVTVPTTKQMTAVPGGSRGTLVVSSTGDKRISSAIFILQVHRDPVEDGDASDSDLSMLQDAIDQTAANASAAQAAATAAQQAASSFTTDTTLSVSGKAADAAETGRQFGLINESLDAIGDGLSEDVKTALLACFANVQWDGTDGKTYYDTLSEALYPQTGLVSITAVFNAGQNVIYTDTPINDLKAYLTVTGLYNDSTSKEVHLYSLTGALTVGTSTITVSYEGKTTTFTVTVVSALDRIAYNNVTYRDMFITNNYVTVGDFESIEIPETEQTLANGDTYKVSNGSPTIASGIAVSGSKSLKVVSTSTSAQLNYVSTRQPTSANMLSAACIRVDSYTSGNVGMQVNVSNAEITNPGIGLVYNNAVTDGFVEVVKIREYSYDASTHPDAKLNVFIGDFSQGKADAYVDLCVVTEIPSGMTLATAQELYHNFVNMVKNS